MGDKRDVDDVLGNNIAGNFLDRASTYWAPAVLFSKQFLGACITAYLVRYVAMDKASILRFYATQHASHSRSRNKTLDGQAATPWWRVIAACCPSTTPWWRAIATCCPS